MALRERPVAGRRDDTTTVADCAIALKAVRSRLKISIKEMAKKLGMSGSTYQHYEDRYKKPTYSIELQEQLADILRANGISDKDIMPIAPAVVKQAGKNQRFVDNSSPSEGETESAEAQLSSKSAISLLEAIREAINRIGTTNGSKLDEILARLDARDARDAASLKENEKNVKKEAGPRHRH